MNVTPEQLQQEDAAILGKMPDRFLFHEIDQCCAAILRLSPAADKFPDRLAVALRAHRQLGVILDVLASRRAAPGKAA